MFSFMTYKYVNNYYFIYSLEVRSGSKGEKLDRCKNKQYAVNMSSETNKVRKIKLKNFVNN